MLRRANPPSAWKVRDRNGRVPGALDARVVVLGYIVRGPTGGLVWHHLQYVLGLARLGADVLFLEDSTDSRWCCYDPTRHVVDDDPTYGLAFAERVFDSVGLGDRWAYHDAHRGRWFGSRAEDAESFCAGADAVLNLSAVNPLREWARDVGVRVLVDTDPVFTQIRHLTDPSARELAVEHTDFFSFGENIGLPGTSVPDDGLDWRATRQPVCLDLWQVTPGDEHAPFTTVMQWESYPAREHQGVRYGMKSDSFADYVSVPQATSETLEIAVGGSAAPRSDLRAHGWRVADPLEVAREPDDYRTYIRSSKGEFGVAKHGYVVSRSGWFSERTAAYLASGRPAVVQDTGFSRWLPTGKGVLSFGDPDEAAACLEEVSAAYGDHCRAAREVVGEYFDASKVLQDLLDGVSSSRQRA